MRDQVLWRKLGRIAALLYRARTSTRFDLQFAHLHIAVKSRQRIESDERPVYPDGSIERVGRLR